jgi:hypothetical protein
MIQAIQTRYRGHKYRSRLEARWAVFFDALGIKFEYEKEGYVLPSGNYLPDFWLPEHKYFIEIKGQAQTDEEETLATELAEQSGHRVFIFSGSITDLDEENYPYVIAANVHTPDGSWDNYQLWCECPTCGRLEIQFEGRSDRMRCKECYSCACARDGGEFRCQHPEVCAGRCRRRGGNNDKGYSYSTARFEFGETPR